jgi:hypothetical protein
MDVRDVSEALLVDRVVEVIVLMRLQEAVVRCQFDADIVFHEK